MTNDEAIALAEAITKRRNLAVTTRGPDWEVIHGLTGQGYLPQSVYVFIGANGPLQIERDTTAQLEILGLQRRWVANVANAKKRRLYADTAEQGYEQGYLDGLTEAVRIISQTITPPGPTP